MTGQEISLFFTTFVMLQFWNLFNARCLGQSYSAFAGLFQNKLFLLVGFVILAGQFSIVQWGGEMFRTVPLSIRDWTLAFGGTSVVLVIGEIYRLVKRIRGSQNPKPVKRQ
ncbi:MAG: cation transporting ATPase C-terminal domain-containing protein [SAR324 cluster bacterium]|nr:cation transporting ATPase C-terminal domain-containing protein [SAR324 cluster bacterium]